MPVYMYAYKTTANLDSISFIVIYFLSLTYYDSKQKKNSIDGLSCYEVQLYTTFIFEGGGGLSIV